MRRVRDERARGEIVTAWREAKAANPKLTQEEFARRALPSPKHKQRAKGSGARYLRKILRGERTGAELYREGRATPPSGQSDLFQVDVCCPATEDTPGAEEISRRWYICRSFDLEAIGARSTLDVFAIERHPEIRRAVSAKMAQWRSEYSEFGCAKPLVTVRRVRKHTKYSETVVIRR
jgi:hypothetical protein